MLSRFRQNGVISSRPIAGNASRWAAYYQNMKGNEQVKIIRIEIVPLFLVFILTACNTAPSTPTTSLTGVMETAISIINAEMTMTQTAIPTITPLASTIIPPDASSNSPVPPSAEELDYAMAIAPKIYNLLPYINETVPYGEYSGCTGTFDFRNYVGYIVKLPMEIVEAALLGYFSTEKWEFTQAAPGDTARTITYDVYRISSVDVPALERLRVILTDETVPNGEDHIRVRAELAYVETKENFRYLLDPFACYDNKTWWLWIRLTK